MIFIEIPSAYLKQINTIIFIFYEMDKTKLNVKLYLKMHVKEAYSCPQHHLKKKL